METPKNDIVLVASDFSEIGDIAIDNAVEFAKLLNFKVCILHVVDKNTKAGLKKEKKSIDSINEKLDAISRDIKSKHSIEVEYVAKEGTIFTAIASVAEEIGASFLLIGTHGKIGIQHLLGSFALKVVKSSPCPIIVYQKRVLESKYNNIVFPLDLSMGSKQKVRYAINLAKLFGGTIHLFALNETDEFNAIKMKNNYVQVKTMLEKANVDFTERFSDDKGPNFGKQVMNFSESINADLIMISTNPDQLSLNFIGSIDEQIIYNTLKIPVMCINALDLNIQIGGL